MTIHDLDPAITKVIEQIAQKRDWSKHKTVKYLLKMAVEEYQPLVVEDENYFSQFCGVWTEEEAREFEEAVADFGVVDQALWK